MRRDQEALEANRGRVFSHRDQGSCPTQSRVCCASLLKASESGEQTTRPPFLHVSQTRTVWLLEDRESEKEVRQAKPRQSQNLPGSKKPSSTRYGIVRPKRPWQSLAG